MCPGSCMGRHTLTQLDDAVAGCESHGGGSGIRRRQRARDARG